MKWRETKFVAATAVLAWAGLLSACSSHEEGEAIAESVDSVIGDTLPGTDADEFEEGADAFATIEGIADGLGPTFNDRACGNCHIDPVLGGSGTPIERRFGRVQNGVFDGMESQGGSLRQLFSNGTYNNGSTRCTIPVEAEPSGATVRNVGRRTTPLFGLGLVDAMPDSFFDGLAAAQPAAIRGIVNRVSVLLPDPRDPSQSIGSTRVGRFGWKAGVPGLTQFSGDAYVNEMGITTQSCFRGVSVLAFANENNPNGIAPPAGCNGGDLAPANPAGNPNIPQFTDDAVGSCAGNLTEIQEDVEEFTTFMEHLAPPPRDLSDAISIARGDPLFNQVGCSGCHVRTTFRTPASPFNGVPGNFAFNPFSDFLVHDMGALGDGIGNTGDPVANTRRMRTAPLWGARFNNRFLHDGRAADVRAAILAHGGQAQASRDAFNALSGTSQHDVVQFVRSL